MMKMYKICLVDLLPETPKIIIARYHAECFCLVYYIQYNLFSRTQRDNLISLALSGIRINRVRDSCQPCLSEIWKLVF